MKARAAAVLLGSLFGIVACAPGNLPDGSIKVANRGLLSASYSPDGQFLFTGSFQHGGALWDQTRGERLYDWNIVVGEYSAFSSADFSEDGKFVAVSTGSTATVFDVSSGRVVTHLQSPAQSLAIENTSAIWESDSSAPYWAKPGRILDIAFSKQYLLLGLENQVTLLIDSEKRSVIGALPHEDVISSVAMDDAANLAITGARDGSAILWSLESGEAISNYQVDKPISLVDMSATGTFALIAAYQGSVQFAETSRNAKPIILMNKNPGITAARFDDTRRQLVVGTARERLILFDLNSGEILNQWQVPNDGPWHKAAIIDLAFRGNDIVAVASDGHAYQFSN